MQNTTAAPEGGVASRRAFSLVAALLIACLALAAAVVLAAPGHALAKSYRMPSVNITAQVETDGSLHVTEQRAFEFDGNYSAVWWTFNNLPSNAEIHVNGVRVGNVDETGATTGDMQALPSVPFVREWREKGGPSSPAYSFDDPKNTVYVFFDATDAHAMVELDYTVANAAQAYEDIGELYWQYVGTQWPEPSDNVTMTLSLPVPQDVAVTPGENVRAWGHGPSSGSLSVGADGTIAYTVGRVPAGEYAEAHVVFPTEWLSNLSLTAQREHRGQLRLDSVLEDEAKWADTANQTRLTSLAFIIGCIVVCVLALAWALWAYGRYGREYKPDFTGEYFRDVPDRSLHPAVVGRLWRWDRSNPDDFTATVMHLSALGAIRIDAGTYQKPGILGDVEVDDYYLTRQPAADDMTDPIDRAALDLLFDRIAGGQDALWFGAIKRYGKENPRELVDAMGSWQGLVTAEANKADFFEAKGNRYQTYLLVLAAIIGVASLFIWWQTDVMIPAIAGVPTAAAIAVIANYMPRRTKRGNNLVARCKALRNWLRDFSTLDDRPPTDVKVWGEFMVYAYLFGVAEQAMKQLRTAVPELFEEDAAVSSTYVPWWFWYISGHTAAGTAVPDIGYMLQASFVDTMATAKSALEAASGHMSSGTGIGGGFSGGGGGGFGGGGGAR